MSTLLITNASITWLKQRSRSGLTASAYVEISIRCLGIKCTTEPLQGRATNTQPQLKDMNE